jgi:endonuclease YncB( thermonuclease family)
MADLFVGKWEMVSSDKFDEYMRAVGVGAVWAKIGSTAKPKVTITVDGDKWTLKSETMVKSSCIEFKLGEEFEETTADDRKMKTTVTLEGNKLTQDQKGEIPSVITREVDGDTMTVLCKAKDVVATRVYKKK